MIVCCYSIYYPFIQLYDNPFDNVGEKHPQNLELLKVYIHER